MSKYISTPAYHDRMPIDISFVFKNVRPAGKHGFSKTDGDNFRFEDGTVSKFWGVMFNGGANFPTHEYAKQVARRLAMAGCNIVRLHQLDAEWCVPNIYQIYAGPRLKNTRELCDESFKRLDYLIHCLKEEGIYITVDMVTYRKFKTGDGVKFANQLGDAARFYSMYDRTMIDLQKEYIEKFWDHYNPYTGLKYKDDPVIVMCTIMNENNLFYDSSVRKNFVRIPYYDNMFRDLFDQWLKNNGIDYDAYGCDLFTMDKPIEDFKMYLSEKYYTEMMSYSNYLDRIQIMGKESSSDTIGSVAYREGYFSIWNDPAKMNLFYHAALMLRRGDVQPAKKVMGAKISQLGKLTHQAFTSAIERHQVHTVLDGMDYSEFDEIVVDTDILPRENPLCNESDTGEPWRYLKRSIGAVDSDRTKIVYGMLAVFKEKIHGGEKFWGSN